MNLPDSPGVVLVPTFKMKEDDLAVRRLEVVFPHQRIVPVPAGDLAPEGGLIHCVTWEYAV